jgi:hypothetical protein
MNNRFVKIPNGIVKRRNQPNRPLLSQSFSHPYITVQLQPTGHHLEDRMVLCASQFGQLSAS